MNCDYGGWRRESRVATAHCVDAVSDGSHGSVSVSRAAVFTPEQGGEGKAAGAGVVGDRATGFTRQFAAAVIRTRQDASVLLSAG